MSTNNAHTTRSLLEGLVVDYGGDRSLVGHPVNMHRLPMLRALEHSGLIEIKVVVLVKRWVVTAAGMIWLLLIRQGPSEGLHLDRDILCGKDGYWMTRHEAVEGMMHLKREDLAFVTDLFGGTPLDPCHAQVLVHLGDGDPLRSLSRFEPVNVK